MLPKQKSKKKKAAPSKKRKRPESKRPTAKKIKFTLQRPKVMHEPPKLFSWRFPSQEPEEDVPMPNQHSFRDFRYAPTPAARAANFKHIQHGRIEALKNPVTDAEIVKLKETEEFKSADSADQARQAMDRDRQNAIEQSRKAKKAEEMAELFNIRNAAEFERSVRNFGKPSELENRRTTASAIAMSDGTKGFPPRMVSQFDDEEKIQAARARGVSGVFFKDVLRRDPAKAAELLVADNISSVAPGDLYTTKSGKAFKNTKRKNTSWRNRMYSKAAAETKEQKGTIVNQLFNPTDFDYGKIEKIETKLAYVLRDFENLNEQKLTQSEVAEERRKMTEMVEELIAEKEALDQGARKQLFGKKVLSQLKGLKKTPGKTPPTSVPSSPLPPTPSSPDPASIPSQPSPRPFSSPAPAPRSSPTPSKPSTPLSGWLKAAAALSPRKKNNKGKAPFSNPATPLNRPPPEGKKNKKQTKSATSSPVAVNKAGWREGTEWRNKQRKKKKPYNHHSGRGGEKKNQKSSVTKKKETQALAPPPYKTVPRRHG